MHDDRRENERYRHASLFDQARDELRHLARSPRLLLLIIVIVGGWVGLVVIQPSVIRLESLKTGDCIYVPVPDNDRLTATRPVGTTSEVVDGLVRAGAEGAPCELSHGHEVAAAFVLPEPAGAPYPGADALHARQLPACEAAFEAYVGRSVAGSTLELTVVVPGADAWAAGRRAGACLVGNADGTFLSGRAAGSGR